MTAEKKCTEAQLTEIKHAYEQAQERASEVQGRLKISEKQFAHALHSLGIERWCYIRNLNISNRQKEKLRTAQREAMLRREQAQLRARFDVIHAAFYGRALFVPSSMMCLRGWVR